MVTDRNSLVGTRWKHIKRGTTYTVVSLSVFQTSQSSLFDNRDVVIYKDDVYGVNWVRPLEEFLDGRFEKI